MMKFISLGLDRVTQKDEKAAPPAQELIGGIRAPLKMGPEATGSLQPLIKWFCVNYSAFVWLLSATATTISNVFFENYKLW